jgi:hypothetical protein
MPALIDLWLMPARLLLDLIAPLKVAPVATVDFVPLAKARYIRRKRKVLRSKGYNHRRRDIKNVDGKMRPGQDWELNVTDQNRNLLFLTHISTKRL